jgi:hypothetical protein
MNIITHALIGWTIAQRLSPSKRDIALITASSILPDVDGIGIVADFWQSGGSETIWFTTFHHYLGHNIFFGVALAIVAFFWGQHKFTTALAALGVFHLHLVCDFIGSRGPEGELWAIHYLYPLLPHWELSWAGQWEINAWPNLVLTILTLFFTFKQARDQGFSPLWYLSTRADAAFVATLRTRFPLPTTS